MEKVPRGQGTAPTTSLNTKLHLGSNKRMRNCHTKGNTSSNALLDGIKVVTERYSDR